MISGKLVLQNFNFWVLKTKIDQNGIFKFELFSQPGQFMSQQNPKQRRKIQFYIIVYLQ